MKHAGPIAILGLSLIAATSIAPQQKEDLYSIPAKSKYSLQSFANKKPLTRAERTNFTETTRYEDIKPFLDSLGSSIHVASMGKTALGRELWYVIASRPLVRTPEDARRLGRPVAYIQGNIHAGEVEGKEASLAMIRDLVQDRNPNVLDSLVVIFQPDYNTDGNEHYDHQARNRGAQNGPEFVGTRTTSCGWNLNRDYVSADAPETKAALAMLNRWNPDLFMDLHTTDGSIHGYALTYSPSLTPTAITTRAYAADTMLPVLRQRMRERHGFEVNDYGDFSRARPSGGGAPGGALGGGGFGGGRAGRGSDPNAPYLRQCDTATFNRTNRITNMDTMPPGRGGGGRGGANVSLEMMIADSIPTGGWAFSTYEPYARYGSNYYGLRGRLSILSEAFSHDPFARRVASTYDFVSEALSYLAENRRGVLALGKRADSLIVAWGNDPSKAPLLATRAVMDTTRIEDVRVEMIRPLTDSSRREPGMGAWERTGVVKLVRMPMMVSFRPVLEGRIPFAYAFDAKTAQALLPILGLHGIKVEKLTAPARVVSREYSTGGTGLTDAGQSESARRMRRVSGGWQEQDSRDLPAGTYVVRSAQPFGLLAFYLFAPENEDGLLGWGFFEGLLGSGMYPVIMVENPVTLRTTTAK